MSDSITYQVSDVAPLTHTVTQILCKPLHGTVLHYEAGQYVEIITPDNNPFYLSIANAPLGTNVLEFHIRHTQDNQASTDILNAIKRGQPLLIKGPLGHCTIKTHKPTLFIAAGTGFAPMKALIEQCLSENFDAPMHCYWGAKNQNDIYLSELPEHWDKAMAHFHYTPVLSNPIDPNWLGARGRVQDIVAKEHKDLSQFQAFVAGSAQMVEESFKLFINNGLPEELFFSDLKPQVIST